MIIKVQHANPLSTEADLLVLPMLEGEKKLNGTVATIDKHLGGIIKTVVSDDGFEGKLKETLFIQTHGKMPAKKILIVGLGKISSLTPIILREASALAVKKAKEVRAKIVVSALHEVADNRKITNRQAGLFIAEGALLGNYHFATYRDEESNVETEKRKTENFVLVDTKKTVVKNLVAGVAEGEARANATIFARDLINTPASDMTPKDLVNVAKKITKENNAISLSVLTVDDAKKLGMGAFLSVDKGSDEPSYIIHLVYKAKKKTAKKVFIVGKGITFDSGGLSLKPPKYQESMKSDMAGCAAVLGVFSKIISIKPQVEVHGVMPVAENMPSGKATKPGDIVKAMNGKTVEILNTDAEGRLILADALSFAVKEKADLIVDLATLTGSCVEALGEEIAALFGNDQKLISQIKDSAKEVGESVWQLPLPQEYVTLIKSRVADIKNIQSGQGAGAVTAALFLKEFVGKTPWVHLDIAGPAWAERETSPAISIGGTGFGVRMLLSFLEKLR